jgi:hypothetical protein
MDTKWILKTKMDLSWIQNGLMQGCLVDTYSETYGYLMELYGYLMDTINENRTLMDT